MSTTTSDSLSRLYHYTNYRQLPRTKVQKGVVWGSDGLLSFLSDE